MPQVINIDFEDDIFLDCYRANVHDETIYDIDFYYGGRDGGKSRFIAMLLLLDCMRLGKDFKCLLIRKQLNTVRASQYSLLKEIIGDWGLKSLFTFYDSRLEIKYNVTGAGFFGRGMDDPGTIKSFNNPTYAWVEEGNQLEEDDFVILLTSLRGPIRAKTYFSFNPECEVSYEDFWLYKEFFAHTNGLRWTWKKSIEIDTIEGKQTVDYNIRATHSTYKDNPYCTAQRRALYEGYKSSKNKAYWYQTYTLGRWGYRRSGSAFYKCFEETTHTGAIKFDAKQSIHISLDNNLHPYVTISIWQVDTKTKTIKQVHEISAEAPNNNAIKAAKLFIKWLDRVGYDGMVFVYGDPSANAGSTSDPESKGFFAKFKGTLDMAPVKYIDRVKRSAPGVSMSGTFVNEIFESNYSGWSIMIDTGCRKAIEDYTMTKEDRFGKVLKTKEKDKDTKVTFERYGHYSDAMRYFLCTLLE